MVLSRPIRLLIVDDSRFVRMALRAIVDADPEIEVVGEARDGADAIALARALRPDVITMDLEMPEVDGLAAIRGIMAERPTPILVLSHHTRAGVWTTFQALGCGAVDFLEKPGVLETMDIRGLDRALLDKIHHWARRPHGAPWGAVPPPSGLPAEPESLPFPATPAPGLAGPTVRAVPRASGCDLVVVAVSTGGPNTLPLLLKGMGGPLRCPMVVAQHMPGLFTGGFAEHLALTSGLDVVEGEDAMTLPPGRIVIIAGGCDGEVMRRGLGFSLRQRRVGDAGLHPSGDLLFESAARVARLPAAVVLTGIGSDGALGARAFAARQLPVFAQTPATAVVWGMPSAVIDGGCASQVLDVGDIGAELARLSGRLPSIDGV
ncbi:MAG: chemotaxis protein CheB [Rhodospirillaceae bacterium]